MNSFKSVAIRVILIVLGFLAALTLGELVLRIFQPVEFRVRGDRIVLPVRKRYICQNDISDKLDPVIIHTKNSLGFRGPESPKNLSDYLSILTVGGSATECFYLSDKKTWPDRLAAHLQKDFGVERLWLNNAGLDGHSTFGHLVMMRDYIVNLKPKVVIFFIGINDIDRTDLSDFDLNQIKKLRTDSFRTLFISMCAYSDVLTLGLNLYRNYKARLFHLQHMDINLTGMDSFEVSEDTLNEAKRYYNRHLIPEYEKRLEELIDISLSAGILPVLVTQPALYGAGQDPVSGVNLETIRLGWQKYAGIYNGKFAWEILEQYNQATRRVADREKIPVIDLANILPKDSSYFYDFIHFSNAGAEKIGQILSREMSPVLKKKFSEYFTHADSL